MREDRNLDRSGNLDQNSSLDEVEETVSRLNHSITVLERTLADPQLASGQQLESALNRQLSIRRQELQGARSRDTSVIVHTSTPDITTTQDNQQHLQQQSSSFFGTQENLAIPDRPFQVFQDPPDQLPSPRQPVIIVNTPSTAFSDRDSNKENRFPFSELIGPAPAMTGGGAAAAAEDPAVTEKRREYQKRIRQVGARLKTLTALYDPAKYPAEVLLENKTNWLTRVEDKFEEFSTIFIDLEDEEWTTEEDKRIMSAQNQEVTDAMTAFILTYNTKVLSIRPAAATNPSPAVTVPPPLSNAPSIASSTSSEAAARRTAQVNVDVDSNKIKREAKLLSKELRKCEDWTEAENHHIEAAMSKVDDCS